MTEERKVVITLNGENVSVDVEGEFNKIELHGLFSSLSHHYLHQNDPAKNIQMLLENKELLDQVVVAMYERERMFYEKEENQSNGEGNDGESKKL